MRYLYNMSKGNGNIQPTRNIKEWKELSENDEGYLNFFF